MTLHLLFVSSYSFLKSPFLSLSLSPPVHEVKKALTLRKEKGSQVVGTLTIELNDLHVQQSNNTPNDETMPTTATPDRTESPTAPVASAPPSSEPVPPLLVIPSTQTPQTSQQALPSGPGPSQPVDQQPSPQPVDQRPSPQATPPVSVSGTPTPDPRGTSQAPPPTRSFQTPSLHPSGLQSQQPPQQAPPTSSMPGQQFQYTLFMYMYLLKCTCTCINNLLTY